jgi:hypothetical protein
MVSGLNIARVAMLVALFGFILPWVMVSCSGQPIAHLSGLDLATGGVTVRNPSTGALQHQRGAPNLWIGLTLAAVLAGAIVGFVLKAKAAVVGVLAAALIALAASVIGVLGITRSVQDEAQRQQQLTAAGQQPVDPSVAALFRVELQYGYYLTVAGLLAAIGAGGLVLSGREGLLTGAGAAAGPPPARPEG